MEVTCRKLGKRDIPAYREIRLDGLARDPEGFGTTYEEEVGLKHLWMEKYLEEEAEHPFVTGAFSAGVLIGIAAFSRDHHRKTRHRGLITQVYVRPESRGAGVGKRLLGALIVTAFSIEGIEQIELGVVTTNQNAVRLYERSGFSVYGVQPRYFKVDGQYRNQLFMQLLKDTYAA